MRKQNLTTITTLTILQSLIHPKKEPSPDSFFVAVLNNIVGLQIEKVPWPHLTMFGIFDCRLANKFP